MKFPRSFYLLFILTLFLHFMFSSSYVLPSQLLRMGFSQWQMGVLMSVFYAGAFATRPLGSLCVERMGIKISIIVSALFGAAAGAAMLSHSFAVLLLSRVCQGIAASLLYVSVMAYQGLAIAAEDRGRLMTYITLASMLPQFVLVPFSEFLIDGGLARVYMLLVTFILLGMSAFALTLPAGAGTAAVKEEREWGTWRELLSRRDTWALLASFFTVTLTANAACQYVPNLMRTLGLRGTPFTTTCAPVSVAIRLTICAWVMTSFDRRRSFCLFATIEALSVVVAGCASSVSTFVAAAVLFGASHGLDYPAVSALLPDVVPPHLMPKGASLLLLVHDLPPFMLPLAIGVAPSWMGLSGVVFAVGVLGVVAFPLIYLLLWRPGLVRQREVCR